ERHRHRYEVNNGYRKILEDAGLLFSGTSPDGRLVEIAELPADVHPFFLGTQAHPEFRSRPTRAHPLFRAFVGAAIQQSGSRAATWHVLLALFTSPGMSDEAVRLYLARDLTVVPEAERHHGEHEEADMPVVHVPLDEAVALIRGGSLHNPLTIMGVLAADRAR